MGQRIDPRTLTVGELVRKFLAHCEGYYRDADGKPTGELDNYKASLNWWLVEMGVGEDLPIVHLAKTDLRKLRDRMMFAGRCRTYINATIRRIRAMVKWAIAEDLIEDTNDDAFASRLLGMFAAVPNLKPHRSAAIEYPKVQPVAIRDVVKTLQFMGKDARPVVEVILRTGARAQEIASLRAGEVTREADGSWVARPRRHKNAWRNHDRVIPLDAACMRIILPRLTRGLFGSIDPNDILFPSRDRKAFSTNGLRSAIARARERAKLRGVEIPHWHLHQMRHTAAHVTRELTCLDDTQALLGHKNRKMTEHYTGVPVSKAAKRAQRKLSGAVKGVK